MPEIKSNIWKNYLLLVMQGFWFVLPIFIFYFNSFGLSPYEIGTLESAFTAFFFLFTIPCGAFSDLISRKLSILLGTVLTSISMIIIGLGSSYPIFFLGNVIWAVGDGFSYNARGAMMYDSVKQIGLEKEYLKISGRANLFSVAPLILSGVLGPIMFSISIRSPWLVMGLLWIFSIPIILYLVEPPKDSSNRSFKIYLNKIKDGFIFIMKAKYVFWIMMFSVTMAIPLSFFNEVISQLYYLEIGYSINHFSIIFPVIYGVASIVASQSHRIEKFLGEKGSFLFIILCHSLGVMIMGLLNTPLVIIIIIITYISRDFKWVFVDNYINKHAESKIRATVLSIISMAASLVLIFVYLIGGFLTVAVGMFQTLFMMGLFVVLCSIILLLTKPKNAKEVKDK